MFDRRAAAGSIARGIRVLLVLLVPALAGATLAAADPAEQRCVNVVVTTCSGDRHGV